MTLPSKGKTVDLKIYHNPRCSKSRQTLELLNARGLEPVVVEYLSSPPSRDEIETVLKALSMEPRELMRQRETVYAELGLDDATTTRDELIQAMIDNPILIERPIVISNGQVRIGRPPESVLEIV